jgi:hypothetical protein
MGNPTDTRMGCTRAHLYHIYEARCTASRARGTVNGDPTWPREWSRCSKNDADREGVCWCWQKMTTTSWV